MLNVFTSHSIGTLALLSCVLFGAGCVRGFAGFGAGMIFIPVAASVVAPPVAAASFLVLDFFVTIPLLFRALRICDWFTVLPAAAGSVVFVHAGAWMLANSDPLFLRWIIFFIVVGVLLLLLSGWRYHAKPSRAISAAVGCVSGVLGGISQVSAPPVVVFWLSSSKQPTIVRANLIVFFALASLGTFAAYLLHGFFTLPVLHLLIPAIPAYGLGLLIGSNSFKVADPKFYRVTAYSLIALAAVLSMPALDPFLR